MKLVSVESNAHWYGRNGESRHDADLRTARKEGLYPSVTSVLQVKAKPALDAWKQQEAILAALTLPRLPDESEQDFAKRVLVDMKATGSTAANLGKLLHDYAENLQAPKRSPVPKGYEIVCDKLQEWVCANLKTGMVEVAMVSDQYGYAGRQDWCGLFADGQYGIVDYKSQNVKPGSKPVFYDEHCWQLAAYAEGNPMRLVNVIINTNPATTGQYPIAVKEWTAQEAETGFNIFRHLLAVWQLERGYDPRTVECS